MRAQGRYLLAGPLPPAGADAALCGPEARHLLLVRRAVPGDRLELFDGQGGSCEAELLRASGHDEAVCRILAILPPSAAAGWRLTVATAVPRGKRMAFLVEKCAELGVEELRPVQWRRCPRSGGDNALERWRRLAQSAAKQSRRGMLMEVLPPSRPADLAALAQNCQVVLLLDPAGNTGLPAALDGIAPASRILALVGPEGGFTDDDLMPVSSAAGGRLRRVRTGDGILRVETAAMAVAATVLACQDPRRTDRPERLSTACEPTV